MEVTWFQPQPEPGELPVQLPSPFDELGPHPLARRAALELMASLPALTEGKMFGVLVVRDGQGRVGYLRAFSGMLDGTWTRPGFVGPSFDVERREQLEPVEEQRVKRLLAMGEALAASPERAAALADREAVEERARAVLQELRDRHLGNRRTRAARRAAATEAQRAALDQESRRDKAERRRAEAALSEEGARAAAVLRPFERRLRALERLRRLASRSAMRKLHQTYVLRSFDGRARPLLELYPASAPPSGAGDCAAPKLLEAARRAQLRPVALAELWWGPSPSSGGRVEGAFYPACQRKCGPLLPFILEGLEVAPPRRFSPEPPAELAMVYQDDALVVLEKPAGLLSVPARAPSQEDSVLLRLRRRFPDATGPLLVHRLDQDTSGLLVAALEPRSHSALQRQFLQREVEKRYVAWLEGAVADDAGTVDFPIRVDLEDRPRQIPDPVHGKRAITHWQVLERAVGRTRVALFPLTGRTHQLRVHASHPLGLGAPIVGDRLYGRGGTRLMLHAEALAFTHPRTGERVHFESRAPF